MGPINLSDIYNCLERIDYSLLLKSLSPFVVYYLGEKNFKSYKLHKEFKTPRVVTIDLPPELTENSQIDEERLLKINFGDSVIKFAKNLIEKMSHADLTLLYHNLSTLNIVTKNLTLKSLLFNCITYGEYSISNNLIRLPNNDKNDAIIHELFHMASTFYRENDPTFFCWIFSKERRRKSNWQKFK